ncbi:hypothetical protein [Sorangium atrum]|uniref:Uncharacterized protein n=1 Tax=Sorangium atrum TaxID=2995308 RepID=A0ABT5C3M6_9BACT|nr:hypothetical protein [Sorangium aterium]MDC0680369.1 hypothetical protein [Sorangium aterium]
MSTQREADSEVDRALGLSSSPPTFAGFGPPERGMRKLSAMTPTQARARAAARALTSSGVRASAADLEVDRALGSGVLGVEPPAPARAGFGPPERGARKMPSMTPTQARTRALRREASTPCR